MQALTRKSAKLIMSLRTALSHVHHVLVVWAAWVYFIALPTLVARLVALVPFVLGWLAGGLIFVSLWMWAAAEEGYRRGRQA